MKLSRQEKEFRSMLEGLSAPVLWRVNTKARFHARKALREAEKSAIGTFPVVVHKEPRKPWIAVLNVEDLLAILKNYGDGHGSEQEHPGGHSGAGGRDDEGGDAPDLPEQAD